MSELVVTLHDSPSGKRTLYDNKDYPGCMGGLMHLFDVNQALAGRKLLTDKKSGAGLEAPRNSFDVGGSIPDAPKGAAGRNEEVVKASASKKSSGLSMKALIAEELSKESDNKNRAPGVVARLMGLDVMPTDSKALQKPSTGIAGKMDVKFAHKSVPERQRRGESSHAFRLHSRKSKAPSVSADAPARNVLSECDDDEDGKLVSRSLPLRSHPQEQQLQEFKKEFEAWQSRKSVALPKRLVRTEDAYTHRNDKDTHLHKKWYQPNAPFPQDGFPSSRMNAAQDRLHGSREFQDALDFLHSNKEFFMRFLQEPNSLVGKHLQDNDAGSLCPPQPPETTKPRRPHHQVPDSSEGSRPQSWVRESLLPRRSFKGDTPKSHTADAFVERSVLSVPVSPSGVGSEGVLHNRYRHAYSPMTSENRLQNSDYHMPTRIVVLKPSPGRVHNLKSGSPVYPRSPKEYMANDVFREDSTAVLERLREKLRKDSDSGRDLKHERQNGRQTHEQYRETSKDPREIAQEIVRQVRESITKDLMVDSSRMRNTARDSSLGRRTMQSSEFRDSIGIPDGQTFTTAYTSYKGSTRSMGMSLLPEKMNGVEGLFRSKEHKIRSLEQLKSKGRRVLDGSNSPWHEGMSNNGVHYEGGFPAAGSEVSQTSKESGGYHMEGTRFGQPNLRVLSQNDKSQVEDGEDPQRINLDLDLEGAANAKCREETEAGSPSSLLRSCSTIGAASHNGTLVEFQLLDGQADLRLSTELGSEIAAESAIAKLRTPLDLDANSIDPATTSCHNHASWDGVQEEVKQTIFVREEQSVPQSPQDVAVGGSIEQQHLTHNEFLDLPAALCGTSVSCGVSSDGDPVLVDKDEAVLVVTSDTSLEVFGASSSSDPAFLYQDTKVLDACDDNLGEMEYEALGSSCTSRILEVALENDALVLPVNLPASPRLVSDGPAEILHSEPVKENLEQPSPVSVLDLPFQDDTPVSMEFKELSSDLQELQARLRLLKFEDGDCEQGKDQESEPNADTYPHGSRVAGEDFVSHEALDDLAQMDEEDTLLLNGFEHCDDGMEERSYPGSGREEMLYVKRVLVASGFTSDPTTILTRWHAPKQPLNPRLFQKLENSLSDKDKELDQLDEAVSKFSSQEERVDLSQRHLFFDCVNEVLLDILGPHFNCCPWVSSPKQTSPLPSGDELVELVWSCLWCLLCSHSETQDTLENLVKKDLGKGGRWPDVGIEAETVGLEVERAILDDLIEESLLVL